MHISSHLPALNQFAPSQSENATQNLNSRDAGEKADEQVRKVEASTPPEKVSSDNSLGEPKLKEEIELTQHIQALAKRDREVRTHERIHASRAGPYGGSPQFQFQRGPDGVLYAVSGSVALDASPIAGNPEATQRKANAIQRAALAPADPSSADRAVAARAASMGAQARLEINQNVTQNAGGLVNAFA